MNIRRRASPCDSPQKIEKTNAILSVICYLIPTLITPESLYTSQYALPGHQ